MAYIETETTGYFKRVGNSFKNIIFGIFLIIASVILLWWNEGRTIETTKSLSEGLKLTVEGSISPINTSFEGKLIHVIGEANTNETLNDTEFGININAIKLIRDVEMYQWKENKETKTKDNVGGSETKTTTYTYSKEWSSNKLNSSGYKESGKDNPVNWLYESNDIIANNVLMGDLKLSSEFISQINDKEKMNIEKDTINPEIFETNSGKINIENGIIYIGEGTSQTPIIGDIKISFYSVNPAKISVIGKQKGEIISKYTTSNGGNISLLQYGEKTIEEMYKKANDDNKFIAWILRIVGLIIMFVGFSLIFGILVTLAKFLPILSDIIGFGTGIISLLLTLILGGLVIIIAWLFVRPIISISLLIIIGSIVFFVIKNKKGTKNVVTGNNLQENSSTKNI